MKAFRKWYNRTIRPYIHNPKDKELYEAGWRAALEEVLKQVETSNSDGSVVVWINKEL